MWEEFENRGESKADLGVDSKASTFRPRLPPLSSRSYASSSSSSTCDDDGETSSRPRENPAQRIRRLKAELAEVEKEINAGGPSQLKPSNTNQRGEETGGKKRKSVLPPREPIDLLSELAGLRERLGGLEVDERDGFNGGVRGGGGGGGGGDREWEVRLSRLGETSRQSRGRGEQADEDKGDEGELTGGGQGNGIGLGDLDKRLALLEDLVGPTDLVPDQVNPTISLSYTAYPHSP